MICIGSDFNRIYQCTLSNFKFNEMDIVLPVELYCTKCYKFGFGVNTTGQYLIILSKINNNGSIFVCELAMMKFYKYNLNCPKLSDGSINMICVGDKKNDELMVYGFIKKILLKENNKLMMTTNYYLIQIVMKYVCIEYIHILIGEEHWQVNIDDILNNLKQTTI